MELTKERLITIIGSAILVIVSGLYLSLYRPLINKLRAAYLECGRLEANVFQARKTIDSLKAVSIKRNLVTEANASLAIDELTREAKLKGVSFVSITPKQIEEPRQGSFYKILPIEMEIESLYEDLGRFLGSLDELKKSIVTVRNFNITSTNGYSVKLKTRLVVNMYLLGKNAE